MHILIDSTGLQVYGAGQWLEAKHGAKSRRTWRKLAVTDDKLRRAREHIAKGLTVREAAVCVKVSKTALYASLSVCPRSA